MPLCLSIENDPMLQHSVVDSSSPSELPLHLRFTANTDRDQRDERNMSEASDRLIHYLSLARTCAPEQAAELILSATADPQLYQFGELLSSPLSNLQTTHPLHYNLLRLFAHGTVNDYKANPKTFPPLTPPHWQKLRILTLLTLAHSENTLHYDAVLPALDLSSVHALESLVIDAVYARLIRAKIHQSTRTIDIAWAVGRDVTPHSVSVMRQSLTDWLTRSTKLIHEIEGRVDYIKAETTAAREAREKAKLEADNIRQHVLSRK